MMLAKATQSHSYVLRLWAETHDGNEIWRVSLTEISTGQRIGFVSLEAAFRYLSQNIQSTTASIITPKSPAEGV